MEASIVIALISLIGTIGSAWYFKKSNEGNNTKSNAEASQLIFNIQKEAIKDLQDQINELKQEVENMKKTEEIHIKEKVRLEERLLSLKEENEILQKSLFNSKEEIKELTTKIASLRKDITRLQKK